MAGATGQKLRTWQNICSEPGYHWGGTRPTRPVLTRSLVCNKLRVYCFMNLINNSILHLTLKLYKIEISVIYDIQIKNVVLYLNMYEIM